MLFRSVRFMQRGERNPHPQCCQNGNTIEANFGFSAAGNGARAGLVATNRTSSLAQNLFLGFHMDVMGAPIQGIPQPSEKRTPAKHQFERPKNGCTNAAAGYSGLSSLRYSGILVSSSTCRTASCCPASLSSRAKSFRASSFASSP